MLPWMISSAALCTTALQVLSHCAEVVPVSNHVINAEQVELVVTACMQSRGLRSADNLQHEAVPGKLQGRYTT